MHSETPEDVEFVLWSYTKHSKPKREPESRFYTLCDNPWREDVLSAARQAVRRNGGAAGVYGETIARVEVRGVGKWLGELARDLHTSAYRRQAVRQVLLPK